MKMAALRQARKELKDKADRDKAMTDDLFLPLDPLEMRVEASLVRKPLEVTAPVPAQDQKIEIHVSTALERAVERLREKARGPQ